ncbi:MAG: hypothetical protein M5U34_39170 [Chloroflexi bacterium]|nr:hypothetical protein [Chloroflexota bacterium]
MATERPFATATTSSTHNCSPEIVKGFMWGLYPEFVRGQDCGWRMADCGLRVAGCRLRVTRHSPPATRPLPPCPFPLQFGHELMAASSGT